jgi:hypothetical protein
VPISVGSVEVDILPSTRGIEGRLRRALVPAATRAGEEAGKAAGRAFGPAMAAGIDNTASARGVRRPARPPPGRVTRPPARSPAPCGRA